jgi:hypothetical protein
LGHPWVTKFRRRPRVDVDLVFLIVDGDCWRDFTLAPKVKDLFNKEGRRWLATPVPGQGRDQVPT